MRHYINIWHCGVGKNNIHACYIITAEVLRHDWCKFTLIQQGHLYSIASLSGGSQPAWSLDIFVRPRALRHQPSFDAVACLFVVLIAVVTASDILSV